MCFTMFNKIVGFITDLCAQYDLIEGRHRCKESRRLPAAA